MALYTARVEKRFKSPGPQPNGLQATPSGLWCIDQVNNKVYEMDWENGAMLHEFDTNTEHSSGITVDGEGNIWISSTFQLEIVKYDPQTGNELARYPDPGAGLTVSAEGKPPEEQKKSSSHGLEWKDGLLYVAAPPTQRIHVVDTTNWKEVRSWPSGGLRVHGIGWDTDGKLWVSDTSAGTVQLMDPENGRVYKVYRIAEPDEIHGLTVRDGEIWYCDANTNDIGVLALDFSKSVS